MAGARIPKSIITVLEVLTLEQENVLSLLIRGKCEVAVVN